MNCRQAEDLFGDYFDERLSIPMRASLDAHFDSCANCQALKEDYRQILEQLASLEAPAPSQTLEQSILSRLLPRVQHERAGSIRRDLSQVTMPSWRNIAVYAAAAVLAFVMVGPRLGTGARFGRELSQSTHRIYSFGAKAYRESERILDEINVLRMTVGVAFEDRIDILNEKLRDLEQAQRTEDQGSEQSRGFGNSIIVSGPTTSRSTL